MSEEKVVPTNATDNINEEGHTVNTHTDPTAGALETAGETETQVVATIPAEYENARFEGDRIVYGHAESEAAAPEGAAEVPATKVETPAAKEGKPSKKHWGRHNRNKGKPGNGKDSRPNPRKQLAADPRWEIVKAAFAEKRNIVVTIEDFAWKKAKDAGKPDLIVGYAIQFLPLDVEGQPLPGEPLPGFLPQSEMQTGIKQKAVLKKELQVKVDDLKFTNEGVRFVVSRRKATADEKKAFIDGLTEDQEVTGKILGPHEHGYFVGLFIANFLPPVMQAWLSKGQVPFAEGTRTPLALCEKQVITARVKEKAESKVSLSMRTPKPEGEKSDGKERPEGQREQRRHKGNGEQQREIRRYRHDPKRDNGPAAVLIYSTESEPIATTAAEPVPANEPATPKRTVAKTLPPARDKGLRGTSLLDLGRLWDLATSKPGDAAETGTTEAAPAAEEVPAPAGTETQTQIAE